MALSNNECLELIGTLFQAARDVDPSLHDLLETFFEPEGEPIANLERCVFAMIQIVRSESSRGYSDVIGRLHDFVRAENDNALSEVVIELTDQEQMLYDTPVLRLSDLPDMDECLEYLTLALNGIRE